MEAYSGRIAPTSDGGILYSYQLMMFSLQVIQMTIRRKLLGRQGEDAAAHYLETNNTKVQVAAFYGNL
jgi:hypothetical protein